MKRKRCLTLLEVLIAMVLVSMILTGLFSSLHQGLKKNMSVKELKQRVLQLEMFQLRMKNLMANFDDHPRLSLQKHPDAQNLALFANYKNPVDPDKKMCGSLRSMVFLNGQKQLCLASWPERGEDGRIEILLDNVGDFKCRLYDGRKGRWLEGGQPNARRGGSPMILSIDLEWDGKQIPFVFFTQEIQKTISFQGSA